MANKKNSIECFRLAAILIGLAKHATKDTSIGEDEITVVDLVDFLQHTMINQAIRWEETLCD